MNAAHSTSCDFFTVIPAKAGIHGDAVFGR
jgi:hypothetical protein